MFLVVKRKTLVLYISLFVFLAGFMGVYAKLSKKDICFNGEVIIIDAGHGGADSGAVGKNGSLEKDINLKLSLKLKTALENTGYKIILTRDGDTLCSEDKNIKNKKRADTKHRLKISEDNPGALFLSIHMNHFTDPSVKGAQVFYSPKNKDSKVLAEIIQQEIKNKVDNNNTRLTKEAYSSIYIMKHISNPAVLIECGFISNGEEEMLLNKDEYQNKLVKAITDAVNIYSEKATDISQT